MIIAHSSDLLTLNSNMQASPTAAEIWLNDNHLIVNANKSTTNESNANHLKSIFNKSSYIRFGHSSRIDDAKLF